MYIVYCDGSCLGNPGPGGWAYVVVGEEGKEVSRNSGFEVHATNNHMELTAALQGLRDPCHADKDGIVVVRSDSQYLVYTFTKGWNRHKNARLWVELEEEVKNFFSVRWEWIRGHNGDYWNEVVDEMANSAAMKVR